MKYNLLLIIFWVCTLSSTAQILEPTRWEATIAKESDTEYTLTYTVTIEKDWHVYSQHEYPEDGIAPIPLTFEYVAEGEGYTVEGKAAESASKTSYNDIFELDEVYFVDQAVFTQKIQVKNPNPTQIKVAIAYQVCKDVCLNENAYFIFDIPALKASTVEAAVFEGNAAATSQIPGIAVPGIVLGNTGVDTKEEETSIPEESTAEKPAENDGLWSIFILAFLSGFIALLTPCVFPMIPMTVSFFTKQSKTRAIGIRNAIVYGIFIIVIYVALGSVVTAIFGADALNALSTNVWFNLIFFTILVFFAFSFLGAFEIMLPNSWANKVDRQADRGGILGIFFMALALAIVSFSCTGPVVGTLLVEAASKGGIAPIVGMFGFSLAIALPFALFALFPGWLNSLPKSGGWLNSVKVVLGFLELAFAFKFLSNADLVLQLHWLERETFLAIWIAIFGTLGLYLLGKIKLPHDSSVDHISVGRLTMGLVTIAFTVYLIPGLWGAPLQLISGFPPPLQYSESPYGVGNRKGGVSVHTTELPDGAKYGTHGIITFTDYDKGLAYAKTVEKPVLIDFTGHACVNCRKMEERVWIDPAVLAHLKNDIVLISLYVDYKKELPLSEQYVSETTGKKIKTIGNKWSDFQITRYKANAQPFYVLVDSEEKELNPPMGYTTSVTTYTEWLKTGLTEYHK